MSPVAVADLVRVYMRVRREDGGGACASFRPENKEQMASGDIVDGNYYKNSRYYLDAH